MNTPRYPFTDRLARILNSNQSRSVCVTGEIHDLFSSERSNGKFEYVSLVDYLRDRWGTVKGKILIVYETNGPIRFMSEAERRTMKTAWIRWASGQSDEILFLKELAHEEDDMAGKLADLFDEYIDKAHGKPAVALEILRLMCLASRDKTSDGKPCLEEDLVIIVEDADMLMPEESMARLSDLDRRRVAICRDWFSEPDFMEGGDSVVLLSESKSLINRKVSALPQILEVSIPSPSYEHRLHYINYFDDRQGGNKLKLWGTKEDFAQRSAALSLHALRQLMVGASFDGAVISEKDVIEKIEEYINSQLGEDTVEFKKPEHFLKDTVGFSKLKKFTADKLIRRIKRSDKRALSGFAVSGSIGSGKTYFWEAVAAELGIVVLVIKNLRNMYYGQTDVVFERLRRVLQALSKVLIFVDEADTQFGGVGKDVHETERRLTGKIQAMMSDPMLRGRVTWLLMTARINLLSPDIRRPGRAGSLIIPMLDPEGDDLKEFIEWSVRDVLGRVPGPGEFERLNAATSGYSAAAFALLREELQNEAEETGESGRLNFEQVLGVWEDLLPPDIGVTRRYQTLQALVNCTRESLLPDRRADDPEDVEERRDLWRKEIREIETSGMLES